MATRFSTIDDSIASFPEDVSIRKVLPAAEEKIVSHVKRRAGAA
jgi:hypothetical protein